LIAEVKEGEWIVKVTDFGLSRKVAKGKYYQKTFKTGDPIKWAAPETFKPIPGKDVFKGRVSERSDRWSFGIVLYELFDLCRNQPYPDLNNASVKGMLGEMQDMDKFLPLDDAPEGIRDLMKDLLSYDSQARPEFPVCEARLGKIYEKLAANGGKLNAWTKENKEVSNIIVTDTYGDEDEKEKEYETQEADD